MKITQGKLWTTTKQQKPCVAQKPRMASQKSRGSLLPASLHPPVQRSLEPGSIASEEFHPMGKNSWRTPARLTTVDYCSLCSVGLPESSLTLIPLTELPRGHAQNLCCGAGAVAKVRPASEAPVPAVSHHLRSEHHNTLPHRGRGPELPLFCASPPSQIRVPTCHGQEVLPPL